MSENKEASKPVASFWNFLYVLFLVVVFGSAAVKGFLYITETIKEAGYWKGYRDGLEKCQK